MKGPHDAKREEDLCRRVCIIRLADIKESLSLHDPLRGKAELLAPLEDIQAKDMI